ncbi:MAG: T9SS type A sorting domain-containing protein, partial [Bacteroidota bacterium]
YNGSSANFRMYIVHSTSKSLVKLIKGGGNGTSIFTEADLDGYDPNSEGIRVAVLEENGDAGRNVDLDVSLDITYGSDNGGGGNDDPVVTEISVDAAYSNCLFGTPVVFRCSSNLENNSIEGRSTSFQKGISVYPSPNNGTEVNLVVNTKQAANLLIEIHDINGRLVSEMNRSVVIGVNKLSLNLPNLTDGIYLLKTTQNGKVEHVRFSVAN